MKQRITSYDTFRAIAAFMVVFIHYPLKIAGEGELVTLFRIAVPFFFLVSGYFHYSQEIRIDKIKRELKKLIYLVITVNLAYLIFRIVVKTIFSLRNGRNLHRAFTKIFLELIRKRFLFFNFGLAGHLWYLRAMIMVVIILIIMKKLKLDKLVKYSLPVIIILDLCVCKYSIVLTGDHIPQKYFEPLTKFIGVGYVYFFLGYFFHEFEQRKIYEKVKKFMLQYNVVAILIIGGIAALNIVEYRWLLNHDMDVEPSNYITTFFLAMSVFWYLNIHPALGCKIRLHVIGRKYSEYIYFYHVLAGKFFSITLGGTALYTIFFAIRPIIIYPVVILGTMAAFYIRDKKKSLPEGK